MEGKNSLNFLSDLSEQIAKQLQAKAGLPPTAASEVGLAVAEGMRRLWGGMSVYICKGDAEALGAKYQEIYEAYRAQGFSLDLCRRYGLSEQRVRQIVNIGRQRNRQKATMAPLIVA